MNARPSIWQSIRTFGGAGNAWRETLTPINNDVDTTAQRALSAGRLLDSMNESLTRLQARLSSTEAQSRTIREEQAKLAATMSSDADRFGQCYPGVRWQNDHIHRELNGAWLDEDLNRARSDLFEAALNLHRAFIANAPGMHGRLIAATKVVAGSVPAALDPEVRLAGWQLFFLIVPVISTTFASVSRMFSGLQSEALGWLLIDEAGQAAPQHAVGAMWRSKRVLVVGDPMQLTPVITIPRKTQEDLASHLRVDGMWVPSTTSVQALADRVGRHGTALPQFDGTSVWVSAPLRVHRRCDAPMLAISNEIAYDNLMINGVHREEPEQFRRLPATKWIDIPAANPGDHLQRAEIAKLAEIVDWMLEQGIKGSDIIAISPFRAVSNALEHYASRKEGLTGGTIHTAQGREAEIVFLVLGGDPNKPGAKRWASSAPNLVNVAASRAKHRLYVIGDRTAWSELPFFSVLNRHLLLPTIPEH